MKSGQSPEDAIQVKDASRALQEIISSMPSVWIEGQITSIKIRPGSDWVFVDLRDVSAEATLNVVFNRSVLDNAPSQIESGQRVLVHGKPEFWMNRGSLVFRARVIQPVGLGELMIQLEKLKQKLLQEGLVGATRAKQVKEIHGEFLAIDTALSEVSEGDICLILIDQVEESLAYLKEKVQP